MSSRRLRAVVSNSPSLAVPNSRTVVHPVTDLRTIVETVHAAAAMLAMGQLQGIGGHLELTCIGGKKSSASEGHFSSPAPEFGPCDEAS